MDANMRSNVCLFQINHVKTHKNQSLCIYNIYMYMYINFMYLMTIFTQMPKWSLFRGARVAQWVRSLDLTTHTSLSPIRRGFAPSFVNYKKGCTRLSVASDKVYQLLAHGRWFSPGTPASSTTNTGRHDIAEILLKVALKHQKSKSKSLFREYVHQK